MKGEESVSAEMFPLERRKEVALLETTKGESAFVNVREVIEREVPVNDPARTVTSV